MSVRICFVCSEYPPGPHGGIGTMVQLLARALVAAGHEARVIGIYPPSYPAPDEEEDHGVSVWRLREPLGRFGWIAGRRALYRIISRWSQADEIDLVEVPDWGGWAAGWPRLNVPVMVRANGSSTYFADEMGTKAARATRLIERASLRRADAWSAVSQYAGRRTRTLFGLRHEPDAILLSAIENPPSSRLPFVSRSRTRVVFTGSLVLKKGVVDLIDAWPSVTAAIPSAELHLYGKDARIGDQASMRAALEARLDESVRATVHFHGHVDRDTVLSALASARIGVFPSYSETFGFAPVEALAMGCPVIHTRLSSGPEVIRDGVDGLLVDPHNSVEIADAICRILQDDMLAKCLSERGPATVRERFSLENALPRDVDFYQQCMSRFRRARGLR